ncbi:MAG: hypothetical protein B1H07_02215 [Campylobacteraceae bacterium 4484_166]|nr:MAG: hypothetical protein B1H07_02215 [Campylobacteraceae bacterium 4484_166]
MLKYQITDPKIYGDTVEKFAVSLDKTIKKYRADMVCFRDKISKNRFELSKLFLTICKKNKISKILINTDIYIAKKLKFDGVHLPSNKLTDIKKAKRYGLFVVASCHNKEEIRYAIKKKCDIITYSPIFNTPNKGKKKGLRDLKRVVNIHNIPTIALGGIVDDGYIKKIRTTKSIGFASIRYFTKGCLYD